MSFTSAVVAALQVAGSTSSTTSVAVTSGNSAIMTAAEVIFTLLAIAVLGTVSSRLIIRIATRAGASKGVENAIRYWILILMVIIGLAAVATQTGLSSQFTTLTLSGIGGLAVTLALQSTLSNVIAGLFMLQDGTLRLGDEIEFGTVRGSVVKLSLRTTWVKTADGAIAVIGNSNLAAGPILNRSGKARLERKLQV